MKNNNPYVIIACGKEVVMPEQKKNYGIILDKLLADLPKDKEAPSLLLHACCGPCSSYVLEYLADYFKIFLLYYNPNISPLEEHDYRQTELVRLCGEMTFKNPVKILTTSYSPKDFEGIAKGFETDLEGGERCTRCYRLRMEEAARQAVKYHCDYFTTTLSISPMKNAQKINKIGGMLEKKYNTKHLPGDFKKKGGYQRSVELSKKHKMYRQDYCGCVYSKRDRQGEGGRKND